MRRRGTLAPRRPFIPGYDVAGVVEASGRSAGLPVGTRVCAMMPRTGFGGYSQVVSVPMTSIVRIPEAVEFDEAVALGLNYITAQQLVELAGPPPSRSSVLIHGAAGGVGTALVDLTAERGLRRFGTASPSKHPYLEERGVTAIDYRQRDFVAEVLAAVPDGVSAVFDGVGGTHLRRSFQVVAAGGRLVAYGASGPDAQGWRGLATTVGTGLMLAARARDRGVRGYAISLSPGSGRRGCVRVWQALLQRRAEGALHPTIAAVVPLEDAQHAHDLLGAPGTIGKVVLRC